MNYIVEKNAKFCKSLRKAAAKMLSNEEHRNMDEFITINQCIQIVKEKCIGTDEKGRYIINTDSYAEMLIDIAEQIYQSALSKLASNDVIQCAWDDKEDCMVFWSDGENGKIDINNKP